MVTLGTEYKKRKCSECGAEFSIYDGADELSTDVYSDAKKCARCMQASGRRPMRYKAKRAKKKTDHAQESFLGQKTAWGKLEKMPYTRGE